MSDRGAEAAAAFISEMGLRIVRVTNAECAPRHTVPAISTAGGRVAIVRSGRKDLEFKHHDPGARDEELIADLVFHAHCSTDMDSQHSDGQAGRVKPSVAIRAAKLAKDLRQFFSPAELNTLRALRFVEPVIDYDLKQAGGWIHAGGRN
jgi:hypothetical protein